MKNAREVMSGVCTVYPCSSSGSDHMLVPALDLLMRRGRDMIATHSNMGMRLRVGLRPFVRLTLVPFLSLM